MFENLCVCGRAGNILSVSGAFVSTNGECFEVARWFLLLENCFSSLLGKGHFC